MVQAHQLRRAWSAIHVLAHNDNITSNESNTMNESHAHTQGPHLHTCLRSCGGMRVSAYSEYYLSI